MDLKRKILRTLRGLTLAAMIPLVASAKVLAQNLPPSGAYQPIPNFTGVGAGLQFREAINDRFSGAQPIAPTLVPVTKAQLAAMPAIDGGLLYCSNCQGNVSCSSGGAGSVAFGMGGDWNCNLANTGGLNSVSNDTNVTGALSSGGTALSLGWNGILPGARGGTGCGAPVAYSALPGSPVTGTTCTITDAQSCVVGTAITAGGSTTKCQITWNGANWMPAGGAAGVSGGGVSNRVLYAANYTGATWAEQVENAIAALPSIGGTVDAQGLCTGTALTAADENVAIGASKPVTLLLGPCTYPLGTNQIEAYQGATLAGVSGIATTITFTGAGPGIAYGNAAGNWDVTFENFTLDGNSTSGSTCMDWSQLFQSQAWAITVGGCDTGMIFGNGNVNVKAAYYDHIYNSHISVGAMGVNFTGSANQDSITGGTISAVSSGGVGALMAGEVDFLNEVDIESTPNPIEISGGWNYVTPGYGSGTYTLESGAQNNFIFGTQGACNDESGNTSNICWTPASIPNALEAATVLGLGVGLPGVPYIGLYTTDNVNSNWLYGPGTGRETGNGWHGHAPLGVGILYGSGGINRTGRNLFGQIPNPGAPTCTVVGTPGTTTITYALQAFDFSGNTGSATNDGNTLVSSDTTVTNAPNTLNGTNYVHCTWAPEPYWPNDGVQGWYFVKNDTTAAVGGFPYAGGVWTANDNGSLSFSSYTAPSRNTTGDVVVETGQIANPVQSPGAACFGPGGVLYSSDTNTCPTPTATATATATATPTATSTP